MDLVSLLKHYILVKQSPLVHIRPHLLADEHRILEKLFRKNMGGPSDSLGRAELNCAEAGSVQGRFPVDVLWLQLALLKGCKPGVSLL